MVSRQTILEILNSDCRKCKDLANSRNHIVVCRGNPEADVAILGMNPGKSEDEKGIPFVGPSGQLLDAAIKEAGFSPVKDFFVTNAVLCYTKNNADPKAHHQENCKENLLKLTSGFERLLLLGASAVQGVFAAYEIPYSGGMFKDMLTGGQPLRKVNKFIFVTYHPSFLLRNGIGQEGGQVRLNSKLNPLYQLFQEEIRASIEVMY